MNFKLFIFVVFGIASINSSIIRDQFINDENVIQIGNVNAIGLGSYSNDRINPFYKIKYLNFNVNNTAILGGVKYPELTCTDSTMLKNKFCSVGNKKYQAQVVKCVNASYMKKNDAPKFDCKLFGQKVVNKNVVFDGHYYGIACALPLTQENAHGQCMMSYTFNDSDKYDENDDVENKN